MATTSKPTTQKGVVTLDQIVREALGVDLGEAGLHRYEQFLGWGIRAWREYRQQLSREFKSTELTMTAWKAIEWPEDYVTYVRVGFRHNGRVIVCSQDPDIPLYFDDEDGDGFPDENVQEFVEEEETIDTATASTLNLNSHGEDIGGLFGLQAKDNGVGYFRVNKERREIQMAPIIDNQTVLLEYIADGYDPTKATLVPVYVQPMVLAFIHWQRTKFSKSASRGEKLDFKAEYEVEFNKVRDIEDDTTIADILEAYADGYTASPHLG
jgi:hypothetical protein